MLTYTILDDKGFLELINKGVYRAHPDLIDQDFKEHYDWLNNHLEKITPKPLGVNYPVWAFFVPVDEPGDDSWRWTSPGIRLTVDVDIHKCLFTSFDKWHYKLNNWWAYPDDDFSDPYDDYFNVDLNKLKFKDYLKNITWLDTIFTIEKARDIQIVHWEITIDMIKDVNLHKGSNTHPLNNKVNIYSSLIQRYKELYPCLQS